MMKNIYKFEEEGLSRKGGRTLKRKQFMRGGAFAASLFAAVTVWQNVRIKSTHYQLYAENLPSAFRGYRIVLLTDIHSRNFAENQEQLIRRVRAARPDLILVAGDWADAHIGHLETCFTQARLLRQIAPVYGVYGNHELRRIRQAERDTLAAGFARAGVQMLHTSGTRVEKNGMYLNLIGVEDPAERPQKNKREQMIQSMDEMLSRVTTGIQPDEYTILLAHRPEFLSVYAAYPIDLVVAGHAHGGQIRLPKVGGLFAPGQGFLPRYTGGLYHEKQTNMIVSRGLGGHAPVRIFNSPEVVLITLHAGHPVNE